MSDIQDSEANLPPDRTPGAVPSKPVSADASGALAASQQPNQSPATPATTVVAATPAATTPPQPAAGAQPAAEAAQAQSAGQAQHSPYTSVPPPHHAGDAPWAQTWRFLTARLRQLSDKAGRRVMQRTLKIGVSARIFHPESGGKGLRSKTLQYLEESIAQWVMSRDVLVFMIPTVNTNGLVHPSNIRLRDYAKHLDGLVLQGGADVSPQSYAQAVTRPEWSGDRVRDMYELELLHEFIEAGKPVLGICRGCQLINVAFGGTLYQDIATDVPTAIPHVNEQYDSNYHALHFPQGSSLAGMVKTENALVNSIHHQAVHQLGRDLSVEAVSGPDQIVEAIRYRKAPFVMGLQWHPEFHRAGGPELLDCTPILDSFLRAARETRF